MATQNQKLIWVLIGDTRQITPVIPKATAAETIAASVTASALFTKVTIDYLTKNLRLEQFLVKENLTEEEQNDIYQQQCYANLLEAIGDNTVPAAHVNVLEETKTPYENIRQLALKGKYYIYFLIFNYVNNFIIFNLSNKGIEFWENNEDGINNMIQFMYPEGLPTANDYNNLLTRPPSKMILCLKNERVDIWNERIQKLNSNEMHVLKSRDYFSDVDDPHGYLAAMLTSDIRRTYTNNSGNQSITIITYLSF